MIKIVGLLMWFIAGCLVGTAAAWLWGILKKQYIKYKSKRGVKYIRY